METLTQNLSRRDRSNAAYAFVQNRGYKNVADAIAQLGHREFNSQLKEFCKDLQRELRDLNKNTTKNSRQLRNEEQLRLLTKRIEQCFEYIQTVPLATRTDIKHKLGLTEHQLFSMVKLGIIENQGKRVRPKWVVKTERRDYAELAKEIRQYSLNISSKSNNTI